MTEPQHGYAARVASLEARTALVAALDASQCKLMLPAADGSHREQLLPPGEVARSHSATRCFMNLELAVPQLVELLRPDELKGSVIERVNAYQSDPERGSPLHFDARTVCVTQLLGSKVWIVAKAPSVRSPHRNCVTQPNRDWVDYDGHLVRLPQSFWAVVLRPGDWLVVPRGTWHRTFTLNGSLSASLALMPAAEEPWAAHPASPRPDDPLAGALPWTG